MSHDDLKDSLRTVAAGVLTPFDADGEIMFDELRANARGISDRGIRTFLANANISEYHSLSHDERIAVTRATVEALPADACVLAGVGGSTRTAIDLIDAFEEVGVDGAMVMPPDHTFKHERGLLTYYRRLADAASVGIVPYVRGFEATVDLLARVTEIDGVAGIKYAQDDLGTFRRAVAASSDEVVWVNGAAEPLAPDYYLEGAESFTAGVSNFEPRVGLGLLEALRAGDWERALAYRDLAIPFMSLREEAGEDNTFAGANSVPVVKYGLDLAGLHGGHVREPLVELSEADRERARRYYEDLQRGIDALEATESAVTTVDAAASADRR